jgi:hypothetical protein
LISKIRILSFLTGVVCKRLLINIPSQPLGSKTLEFSENGKKIFILEMNSSTTWFGV